MHELRSRCQVEISEINGRLSKQYEDNWQQPLRKLREQHEGQMRAIRDGIKMIAIEELRATRTRIDGLKSYIRELESTNAALNGRNCDLEKLLANERRHHAFDADNLEAQLQLCRNDRHNSYKSLLPMKNYCAAKKKILAKSAEGRFQDLYHGWTKGTKEVHICGRQIKRNADDKENDVNYHRSVKVEGDVQKLILSATHKPSTIIFITSQKWQSGDSKKTSRFNVYDEEVAGVHGANRTFIRRVSCHSTTGTVASSCLSGKQYPTNRKCV
ncbi:lamin Dm0-like [Musca autumnalis]|uniref:lamin Dm0-like n=1 Tax=Musca autumnalis TaxID=221902 RepID=UPI003CF33FBC